MYKILVMLALLALLFCTSCRYFEQKRFREGPKMARITGISELPTIKVSIPKAKVSIQRDR